MPDGINNNNGPAAAAAHAFDALLDGMGVHAQDDAGPDARLEQHKRSIFKLLYSQNSPAAKEILFQLVLRDMTPEDRTKLQESLQDAASPLAKDLDRFFMNGQLPRMFEAAGKPLDWGGILHNTLMMGKPQQDEKVWAVRNLVVLLPEGSPERASLREFIADPKQNIFGDLFPGGAAAMLQMMDAKLPADPVQSILQSPRPIDWQAQLMPVLLLPADRMVEKMNIMQGVLQQLPVDGEDRAALKKLVSDRGSLVNNLVQNLNPGGANEAFPGGIQMLLSLLAAKPNDPPAPPPPHPIPPPISPDPPKPPAIPVETTRAKAAQGDQAAITLSTETWTIDQWNYHRTHGNPPDVSNMDPVTTAKTDEMIQALGGDRSKKITAKEYAELMANSKTPPVAEDPEKALFQLSRLNDPQSDQIKDVKDKFSIDEWSYYRTAGREDLNIPASGQSDPEQTQAMLDALGLDRGTKISLQQFLELFQKTRKQEDLQVKRQGAARID